MNAAHPAGAPDGRLFAHSGRFVVLGLARPRTPWFNEVGRWATAGTVPLEFLRCVSGEEVRARLASGRAFSALLVDGASPEFDRDLSDAARDAGAAVLVVEDATTARDWQALQVSAVLISGFSRAELVQVLEDQAHAVAPVRPLPLGEGRSAEPAELAGAADGHLVAVLGPGGTGVSVLSMALAQALGEPEAVTSLSQAPRSPSGPGRGVPTRAACAAEPPVLLADLALDADQAMLHDAPDIVPGISEVAEAYRAARLSPEQLRSSTFAVAGRNYQLLLGLRRHRDWCALRPRAVEAALVDLRRAFPIVVADTDADLEGEADCGAIEVEERNVLARSAARHADVVVVVGLGDLKGLHAMARTVSACRHAGIDAHRLLPVVNLAPRSPRARSDIARTLNALIGGPEEVAVSGAVFVAHQRRLETALRDGARLPDALGAPLAAGVVALVNRYGPHGRPSLCESPERMRPGALGTFFDQPASTGRRETR